MANTVKTFLADKVAHIKKPEASLTDVDIGKVSRDAANFNSKISIDNPYDHDLPICEISYTLKSANRIIAEGKMADPGSIGGLKVTMLDVPMKVPYDILVSLAKDVSADWDIDYHLVIGLTIDLPILGNFTIPLTKEGALRLPTLASLF